jgi:hypothetical protein
VRRNAEKLRAVLPVHPALIYQPEIRFIHQSGGLQSMARRLDSHVTPSNSPQFVMYQWQQLVQAFAFSTPPSHK